MAICLLLDVMPTDGLQQLIVQYNNAMRITLQIRNPRDISPTELLTTAKVQSLEAKRSYYSLRCIFRLPNMIEPNLVSTGTRTRAQQGPFVKLMTPKSTGYLKSPTYKAMNAWNNLPATIRV